jgi:hypothetical protein
LIGCILHEPRFPFSGLSRNGILTAYAAIPNKPARNLIRYINRGGGNFFLGHSVQGMAYRDESKVFEPKHLGFRLGERSKHRREDRNSRHSSAFEFDTVVATPRRAGPSIADTMDHGVGQIDKVVHYICRGGLRLDALCPLDDSGNLIFLLDGCDEGVKNLIGVDFLVAQDADRFSVKGIQTRRQRRT